MIEVKLTAAELLLAAQAGVMRQVENVTRNQGQNTHGNDETKPWQDHIEGACGEMALSKYLGVFWKGKGKWGDSDVADMDVRTRPFHEAELILHPPKKDKPHRIFWHVTGKNGVYMIHGWIYAHEGQKQEFWQDKYRNNRPAFFVPNSIIRPVEQFDRKYGHGN